MWLKPGGGGSALSSEQSPPSGSGTGSGTGSGGRVGEKAGRTLAACTLSEFNQSPTDSLADTLAESWVKKGKRKRKKRISRQRESGESSPKEGRLSRQVFASAVCFKVTRRWFLRFFFFFFLRVTLTVRLAHVRKCHSCDVRHVSREPLHQTSGARAIWRQRPRQTPVTISPDWRLRPGHRLAPQPVNESLWLQWDTPVRSTLRLGQRVNKVCFFGYILWL